MVYVKIIQTLRFYEKIFKNNKRNHMKRSSKTINEIIKTIRDGSTFIWTSGQIFFFLDFIHFFLLSTFGIFILWLVHDQGVNGIVSTLILYSIIGFSLLATISIPPVTKTQKTKNKRWLLLQSWAI